MNKGLKITLRVLVTIILVVVLLLALVKVGERIFFTGFFTNAETEFKIPGLNDGYIPQGFEKIELEGKTHFLACGYMKNKSSSRVYLLEENGNILKEIKLFNEDGGAFTGHAGGLTYQYTDNGNYLYISGSKCLYVFDLDDVLGDDDKATRIGKFNVSTLAEGVQGQDEVSPAYCKVFDGYLYCGSFHDQANGYPTTSNQHFTKGEIKNHSTILKYKLDPSAKYGLSLKPEAVYSTPSTVQGMTISNGKLFLSCSWGLSISKIHVYDLNKIEATELCKTDKAIWDNEYPVYFVGGDNHITTISAPPMAEEIVYHDGRIWIMNESACNKYIFGKFTSGNYLYSYYYNTNN